MAQGSFDAALINAVKGLSESKQTGLNPMQRQVLTGLLPATLEERRKYAFEFLILNHKPSTIKLPLQQIQIQIQLQQLPKQIQIQV